MSRLKKALEYDLRKIVCKYPKIVLWSNFLLPISWIVFNVFAFNVGVPSWLYLTASLILLMSWAWIAMLTINTFHDVPWWVIFVQFVTIYFYVSALWKLFKVIRKGETITLPEEP